MKGPSVLEAECPQLLGNARAGFRFTIGQFRILVKVSSPLNQFRLKVFGLLVESGLEGWGHLCKKECCLEKEQTTHCKFFHLCSQV